jgi:hypothetical protein
MFLPAGPLGLARIWAGAMMPGAFPVFISATGCGAARLPRSGGLRLIAAPAGPDDLEALAAHAADVLIERI